MNKILLLVLCVTLASCVHKNMMSERYMTNDEVIKEVERVSNG